MSGLFGIQPAAPGPDAPDPDLEARPAAPPARRRMSAATIPEQVAKHLGQAILNGQYAPGEQIKEQAIAELFDISRGPVRDALRVLEKQGLVQIAPRRGAFVVELRQDDLIDIFNIRSALLSLAVRYLAINPDKAALAPLRDRLDELRALGREPEPALIDFVRAIGRMGVGLMHACGNRQLIQAYRTLPHDGVWQMLWVTSQPMDYITPARRAQSVADYERVLGAIAAGDAETAERAMRKIMQDSRNEVLSHMQQAHPEPIERFRLQTI